MDNTTEKTNSLDNIISTAEENPNVFRLKMENIPGTNTEVLTIYLYELNNFIRTHNLTKAEKMLYSALQSSLEYYKYISDPNSPFFASLLDYTEKETAALQKKYPGLDIKTSLRIKSPISAYNKILDKIQEYIRDGRDLNDLNSSLRDFIGIRRIISQKNVIKSNPRKSALKTLEFAKDQLLVQEKMNFGFIPIRDSKIQEMEEPHAYYVDPESQPIYIPKLSEIPHLLMTKFRNIGKNYIAFPKPSLYQSYQYCTFLPFSDKYAVEYQIRDEHMHDFAEHGPASHTQYKHGFDESLANLNAKRFTRANLPLEYEYDPKLKKMIPYTLDKSMKAHLGYSFVDRFGISEDEFYKNFTKEEQDSILALHSGFVLDEKTGRYRVAPLHTVRYPSLIKTSPDKLHRSIEEKTPIHSAFDGR